jgi:hypothetical protein
MINAIIFVIYGGLKIFLQPFPSLCVRKDRESRHTHDRRSCIESDAMRLVREGGVVVFLQWEPSIADRVRGAITRTTTTTIKGKSWGEAPDDDEDGSEQFSNPLGGDWWPNRPKNSLCYIAPLF